MKAYEVSLEDSRFPTNLVLPHESLNPLIHNKLSARSLGNIPFPNSMVCLFTTDNTQENTAAQVDHNGINENRRFSSLEQDVDQPSRFWINTDS